MKKWIIISIVMTAFIGGSSLVFAAEKAPQELVDRANTELVKLADDSIIVKAVKAQNAKGMTMDQIKEIGEKWEEAKETDEVVKAVTATECAKHLKELLESNPALKGAEELYVLDKKGALVASVKYEEDYFWGENNGFVAASKGNVHVGDFMLDEDDDEYLVHIMVPIKDGGQVIGAIDIGVEMDD